MAGWEGITDYVVTRKGGERRKEGMRWTLCILMKIKKRNVKVMKEVIKIYLCHCTVKKEESLKGRN